MLSARDNHAQSSCPLPQLQHLGLALFALGACDKHAFLRLAIDMERSHLGRAKAGQVGEHGGAAQVAEGGGLAQRPQVKTHHLAACDCPHVLLDIVLHDVRERHRLDHAPAHGVFADDRHQRQFLVGLRRRTSFGARVQILIAVQHAQRFRVHLAEELGQVLVARLPDGQAILGLIEVMSRGDLVAEPLDQLGHRAGDDLGARRFWLISGLAAYWCHFTRMWRLQ